MDDDMALTLHDPLTRFIALIFGMIVTVTGGVVSATWLVRGTIDEQIARFEQRETTLSSRIDILNNTVQAETKAREKAERSVAAELQKADDSRRAELSGVVLRLNETVTRIDGLMQRQPSWSPRGDITQPDKPPG